MTDVYDLGRPTGQCPRCGGVLEPPDLDYEAGTYEGPSEFWCPACGWEDSAAAPTMSYDGRTPYDPLTPWVNVEDAPPL